VSTIELDVIEGITYNPTLHPIKNCHPLEYLPEGIHRLALSVRAEEIRKLNSTSLFDSANFSSMCFDSKTFSIVCEFHWFANSIVNYARLVGFVEIMGKQGWEIEHLSDKRIGTEVNEHCRRYVQRVMPDVYIWRNKVSAHFAATDPFSKDNWGTLQDSMIHPISYSRPYFFANSHSFSKGGEVSEIPEWSLTQTFEKLSSRFFPQRTLPSLS
jgi:hypothetical protein